MTLMSRLMVNVLASGHVVLLIVNTSELRLPILESLPLQIQDCCWLQLYYFPAYPLKCAQDVSTYNLLPNFVLVFIQYIYSTTRRSF